MAIREVCTIQFYLKKTLASIIIIIDEDNFRIARLSGY